MTRPLRRKSASGVYHVITRGINKQNIFECREDFEQFERTLSHTKQVGGLKVYGYCLMSNHIHAIVGVGEESLSASFHRINMGYAFWFNQKYKRCGSLFQDRFRSEPIEDDAYLLTALRYVHRNPVAAGLCRYAYEYRWSSYKDYMNGGGITDTSFILEMFSENPERQLAQFAEFMGEDDKSVDTSSDFMVWSSDEFLREKMANLCGAENASEFQKLSSGDRERALRSLRAAGMSIRQIVRLTGISFGVVRKY